MAGSRYVWIDPNNPRSRYFTQIANDPGVPAGYILTSTQDGSQDRPVQTFQPGNSSGGYPTYGPAWNRGTYIDGNGTHNPQP